MATILEIYTNGFIWSTIGILLYHYMNIICFLVWATKQETVKCLDFSMPFGLPCTMVSDGEDTWAGCVMGNIFIVSFILVFLAAGWPLTIVVGLPLWVVASTRNRLYGKIK